MWRALMSCIPSLRIYSDISLEDMSAVKLILSAVEEMKMCGVSPGILEKTSYGIADEKLSASSFPMPMDCEPWPGKTKALVINPYPCY